MKTIRRTAPLAVLGVGLVVALTILALWLSGHSYQAAQANGPVPVIVGFDMDPTGNSCPHNGTDCTLGDIDPCIEVDVSVSPATFNIDVFLEGLPAADSILGDGYAINWTPDALLTVNTQTHIDNTIDLLAQGGAPLDLSENVPDTASPHNVSVADFGAAEYNPPYTHGTLGRYNVTVPTGTAADLYDLTLSSVTLGRDVPPAGDLCVDYGCDIWDANATPQAYGQIAVAPSTCPPPLVLADVGIVSHEVLAENCTDPPPTQMPVDTDRVLCLHKAIVNAGPESPVDVSIDAGLTGAGDCTITPDPTNPTSYTGLTGAGASVDEKFTVNCTDASTHGFTFTNDVVPTAPAGVIDPDETNNTDIETDFSIPVTAPADVAIDSQAFDPAPPTEIIVGVDTTVTLKKHLINDGPYGPVDVDVTTDVTLPTPPPTCTATLDDQDPDNLPVSLAVSVDVVVDEDWTVNCGAEATGVVLTFNNSIGIITDHVNDPGTANNSASTDLTVDVVPLVGDVNCSGVWNDVDAFLIFQYVMGLKTEINQCPLVGETLYLPGADVNGDTTVDMVDAFLVYRCWMGYHNVFCPEF